MNIIPTNFKHPWFQYAARGACPITFIFNKPEWSVQDPDARAVWEANNKIVQAHGGRMIEDGYRVGRTHQPPLTLKEVKKLIALVRKHHPKLDIYTHWNGTGCYTLSIGAKEAQ